MRRSGGAATWLVFLLPLSFIFAVCAGSARADEADASLLRTKAWLAELDEFAAALSAMPELRLSGMDNDRLRALAALLHLPPEPENRKTLPYLPARHLHIWISSLACSG